MRSAASTNDIQFFPEGGQLLVGLRSKLAFKAIRPNGLGIDVKGTITDNENNVVSEFSSSHLGMGVFAFTPADGKTYTAKVTFADGTAALPELPKIQTGGIVLGLDNRDTSLLTLKLQADPSFLKAYEGKTFYILAKSGGVICFGAQTQLHGQVYNATIPKSKFPTGIVQVTLFSDEGEALSERVAFIQHNDMLNLSLAGDKPSYTTRQKVKLNFTAKNISQPVEGNFSIAVIDDSKVPFDENAETTILTNLLLTSDIKGYIEKPNYYFNRPDEKTAADLDVLMQTQAYRRFSYEGVMNNKFPSINFAPELGLDISGTLRASNGIPVKSGNVRLLIADKNYSESAVTDFDGHFKFSHLVFSDSSKLVISARNNPRSSDLVITLDGEPAQNIGANLNQPDEIVNIDSTLSAYLKNSKVKFNSLHVLKEVVIRDTKIVKTISHRDYGSLSSLGGEADHVVPGSLLKGCPSVLTCLMSLAMGMTFDQGYFYVTRDYNQGKRVPAQVFMRGAPIDVNTLASITPENIESVEIFTKDELGLINSAYGTSGAIVVNMRKIETTKISLQELQQMIPQKNEITFTPKGYAVIRTFYLPRYSGPRESQTNQTDTRSTIYWNPNITTDKTGTASFEYFNADGRGTYRAIIEGFDKDGNLGRGVLRYTVK
ncbi:MAG: carboxypeptidase-like regulatory domain-containing protein [Bacteroidota bacterium]|nr:carboxypeptidase-like regulatory domain-containing protein [Bacteroidota bacterium]